MPSSAFATSARSSGLSCIACSSRALTAAVIGSSLPRSTVHRIHPRRGTEDHRLKAVGSGEPGRLKATGRLASEDRRSTPCSNGHSFGALLPTSHGSGPSGLLKPSPKGEGFSPSPSMDTESAFVMISWW
jgi:hypothetical protein